MKEAYEFLKEAGTYYLATVDGEKARVRPFGTVNIFENKLYIQTGKEKNVSQQMKKNPQVELCAMKDSEWIRVSGTAVIDDRVEAKKDMLDHYPSLRSMYDEQDDHTEVFYLKDGTATISSFEHEDKVFQW